MTVAELAMQYCPKSQKRSAVQQLKRWIKINPELSARLKELCFQPRQRELTPLQYKAILQYLGEP